MRHATLVICLLMIVTAVFIEDISDLDLDCATGTSSNDLCLTTLAYNAQCNSQFSSLKLTADDVNEVKIGRKRTARTNKAKQRPAAPKKARSPTKTKKATANTTKKVKASTARTNKAKQQPAAPKKARSPTKTNKAKANTSNKTKSTVAVAKKKSKSSARSSIINAKKQLDKFIGSVHTHLFADFKA